MKLGDQIQLLKTTIWHTYASETPFMMCDGWMDEPKENVFNKNSSKVFQYVNSLIGSQELVSCKQISDETGVPESQVQKILDGLLEEEE